MRAFLKPKDNTSLNLRPTLFMIAAALIGAALWLILGIFFEIIPSYMSIFLGFIVGGSAWLSSKNTNKKIVIAFAVIASTIFGILLGNFLYWYFDLPEKAKEQAKIVFSLNNETVATIKNDDLRKDYPFIDYLKESFEEIDSNVSIKNTTLYIGSIVLATGIYYLPQIRVEIKKKEIRRKVLR